MITRYDDDEFGRVWRDPLSRRRLLQLAGIGVGAVAVGGVASACSSGGVDSSADPTTGGTLAAGMSRPFLKLDPTTTTPGSLTINGLVYESLYRLEPYAPRTDFTPELAVDFPEEVSPTSYLLRIRDGVTFHDGSSLTADDVVFSIERTRNPETSPAFARFLSVIAQATATSDTEVQLELSFPSTLLTARLALIRGILSRAAVEASPAAIELAPVGTGPYLVSTAVSGERVTLTRFDDYTGAREMHYDELDISIAPDANARISGLTTSRFTVIEEAPESAYEQLRSTDGVEVEAVPSAAATTLLFNCAKPPFDNVSARQAVLYAIDRDSITEASFFGLAEPAWAACISPEITGQTDVDTPYAYDPERARTLLTETGYAGGDLTVDLLIDSTDYISSQGPIIEENLRAAGFAPNLVAGDGEAHVASVSEGNYNVWLFLTSVDIYGAPDAEFILRWLYTGFTPEQFARWTAPEAAEVTQLLDAAIAASGEAERDSALKDVQSIIHREAPLIPLHFKSQLTAWRSNLQGFRPLPTYGLSIDDVQG
jgi:peptide/nickel transport system substrate-binding protein